MRTTETASVVTIALIKVRMSVCLASREPEQAHQFAVGVGHGTVPGVRAACVLALPASADETPDLYWSFKADFGSHYCRGDTSSEGVTPVLVPVLGGAIHR